MKFPLAGQNLSELYVIVDTAAGQLYHPHINSHDGESINLLQKNGTNVNEVLTLTNIDFCQNARYSAYQYELDDLQTLIPRGFVVDSQGNFYINGGGTHRFIMKVNKDFSPGWCFYLNDSLPMSLSPLAINSDDELVITGGIHSPNVQHSFVLKIDASGNIVQGLKFADGDIGAYTNLPTADGGWLLANSRYIIKMDADLNEQWVTKLDQSVHLGSSPVETNDGYFLVYERFSTDQIIGVFIDKQGHYKWDTGLLENHHFGSAYALGGDSILLYSSKYSGNPSSVDYSKQASFIYNTKGHLQSYILFNQADGYLRPTNNAARLFKFKNELLFCRSIGWRSPLPFIRTAFGPVPFSSTSSNCLKFFNSSPTSLPFPISMQKVQALTYTSFTMPLQSISVTASGYRHDSIIQLCPNPFATGELNFRDTLKICEGHSMEVHGLTKGDHYWSTGDTTSSIEISQEGEYFLQISDPCGRVVQRDSFVVKMVKPTPVEVFGDSVTYTFDEVRFSTNLRHRVRWYIDESFYEKDTGFIHSFPQPGVYQVRADYLDNDSACLNTAAFSIEVLPRALTFPNIFTPNGDGINDVFKSMEPYHRPYKINIYNRYGRQVASVTENGWDGQTHNGKEVADGVYYYIVNVIGETEVLKGFVTLIR